MCNFHVADGRIHVISLTSRQDRRKIISNSMDEQGLNYSMHDAVDGRKIKPLESFRFRHTKHYHHKLSSGMKGCILSHESLWAKLLKASNEEIAADHATYSDDSRSEIEDEKHYNAESGLKRDEKSAEDDRTSLERLSRKKRQQTFHIILEDDADIPSNFLRKVDNILEMVPCDAQLVYIGSCYRKNLTKVAGKGEVHGISSEQKKPFIKGKDTHETAASSHEEYVIMVMMMMMAMMMLNSRQYRRVLCTHAYMLTMEAAEKLLEATQVPFESLDQMMNKVQRRKLVTSYVLFPDLVGQYESPSDIYNPTTPGKSLDYSFIKQQ
eukprot:jgi/Bigna1/137712/aug1.40_g12420